MCDLILAASASPAVVGNGKAPKTGNYRKRVKGDRRNCGNLSASMLSGPVKKGGLTEAAFDIRQLLKSI